MKLTIDTFSYIGYILHITHSLFILCDIVNPTNNNIVNQNHIDRMISLIYIKPSHALLYHPLASSILSSFIFFILNFLQNFGCFRSKLFRTTWCKIWPKLGDFFRFFFFDHPSRSPATSVAYLMVSSSSCGVL